MQGVHCDVGFILFLFYIFYPNSMVQLLCCPFWSGSCRQLLGGRGQLFSELRSRCQTPESVLVMLGHILEIVENH